MTNNKDIQRLKQMLEANSFDPAIMSEILSHYQDTPPIVSYIIPTGSKIIRSSTNDAKEFHENVARLSYPPVEFTRTDRASLKGKPMFYGTIFTSAAKKKKAYPRIFSAMETTDILRDFQRTGKAYTTQSLWLNDRDLHVFAFPFSTKYKRACAEIKIQQDFWKNTVAPRWDKEHCEFAEYLGDLIAEEKYSCLYDITANTIDYILYKSSAAADLDGIIYPSVWGDGEGMNICIKKETVDGCIHFQSASVQCIDKKVGQSTIFGIADSYLLPNGTLKWIITDIALNILKKTYSMEDMMERDIIRIVDVNTLRSKDEKRLSN